MAYSYNRYISNGVTTTFTSPPYLEPEHISVEVQGVALETSAYTLTGTVVNLHTVPLVSQEIIVRRSTSPSTRLVTFTSTYLDEADLNRNADQLLYLMQEALDAQVGVAEYIDNVTSTEKLAAKVLTTGQTVVVFAETLGAEPYFRVNGESVDNTLLSEGTDYTLDLPNRTVTLAESYPAGTIISAYGLFTAVGGENYNTTQVAQNVIDIAQNAVDIDALEAKGLVSVKDFATVAEAVAYCYTNSLGLYWPEVETVVVNIPNLHDVKHFGSGGVTRGGNTWYVEQSPNQENRTLYVSSESGSNTNDGLDTAYPLQYEPYALTAMLTINPNNGEQGFITLKNDHVIVDESMMVVEKVNAGWITINSDGTYGESNYTYSAVDKVSGWTAGTPNPVTCSCTASTASRYVVATEADAPNISVYVDGNAQLDRLYSLNRSRGMVNETYGGQNFRNDASASRPLYANGGQLNASKTVWINYHSSVYFSRGASVNFSASLVKNTTNTANGALTLSRGAACEAMGFEAQSCAFAIEVKRAGSSLNAHRAVIDTTSDQVAIVHRGGTLALGGAKITETALDGILVQDGGVLEFASGGTAYGFGELYATAGNTTGYGIKCSGGSQCGARSVTVDGFKYNVWALKSANVDISNSTITNADTFNVWATDGGFITCSDATITGAGAYNIQAIEGSQISCIGATVTGAATNDIYVLDGGFVTAFDTTTSTAGSTPNTADTNLSTFSELTKKGYILAD